MFDTAFSGDADHSPPDTQSGSVSVTPSPDLAPTIEKIRQLHRQRKTMHVAEKSLTLQIRSLCKMYSSRESLDANKKEADQLYDAAIKNKGDHPLALFIRGQAIPFLAARDSLFEARKGLEGQLEKLAKTLPVAAWVAETRGFGVGNLAAVIGEAGDLANYANPAKLWKRMGLAVINGGRQRKVTGAEALIHGYSPPRRSVFWNVGQCVLKAQSVRVDKETGEILRVAGPYRVLYDERKATELPKCEAIAADPVQAKRYTPDGKKKYAPLAHANNRATRYMEKRLLRDLWRAWRGQTGDPTE